MVARAARVLQMPSVAVVTVAVAVAVAVAVVVAVAVAPLAVAMAVIVAAAMVEAMPWTASYGDWSLRAAQTRAVRAVGARRGTREEETATT